MADSILPEVFPQQARDIFAWVYERSPRADFGPGHIVYDDFNLETCFIESCLKQYGETTCDHSGKTPEEYAAEITGLRRLLEIPEDVRMPAEVYDQFEGEPWPG